MKLTSNDCKQYIVDWYSKNRSALKFFEYALPLDANGCSGGLSNGLNLKDWKRQAIATIDKKVYRLFAPNSTVIDPSVMILLIENNGIIESLTIGVEADFKKYFGKVGYWA